MSNEIQDITVEILRSIRYELRALREDTNTRFERMDRRFEQMEKDISQIRRDISYIVAKFDNDLILLSNEINGIKRRLKVCEDRLGIHN